MVGYIRHLLVFGGSTTPSPWSFLANSRTQSLHSSLVRPSAAARSVGGTTTTDILSLALLAARKEEPFFSGGNKNSTTTTTTTAPTKTQPPRTPSFFVALLKGQRPRPFRRMAEQIFMAADLDHDDKLTFDDVYELALRVYIVVNRQAPIPPPSREMVRRLFDRIDRNHNGVLTRDEFLQLSHWALGRTTSRLVSFKVATLVGAPLVVEWMVQWWNLKPRPWLHNCLSKVVTDTRYLETITSRGFARTVLLLGLVSTLGSAVLKLTDLVWNRWLQKNTRSDQN